MSELRKPEPDGAAFRLPCVSVDIEVGGDDRIGALGVVRPDTGRSLTHSDGGLAAGLAKLDDLAEGASFVLGLEAARGTASRAQQISAEAARCRGHHRTGCPWSTAVPPVLCHHPNVLRLQSVHLHRAN